jgi:uncharacterized YigZ family protein
MERVEEAWYEPASEAGARTEIKKSIFIATVRKVESSAEAKEALAEERKLHPDASSIAYAYRAGPPLSETAGMSDGGEPKGTAGRPIMDVLKGSGLRNALLTVTRYYGGTKLGTGGLVHAFGGTAKEALSRVERKEVIKETTFTVELGYEYYESFKRELAKLNAGAKIMAEDFGENVRLELRMPDKAADGLKNMLRDLTKGKGRI